MSPSSVPDVPFLYVCSPRILLMNFVLFRMSSSVKNCMKESGSSPTMYSSSMKTAVTQFGGADSPSPLPGQIPSASL